MFTIADFSPFEASVLLSLIGATCLVLIVWAVMYNWRRLRVAGYNARLKQLMLQQGMSAEEIERVLRADETARRGQHFRPRAAVLLRRAGRGECCPGEPPAGEVEA